METEIGLEDIEGESDVVTKDSTEEDVSLIVRGSIDGEHV